MREQRQRLEHHAEVALMRRDLRDVLAVDQDAAGGRLLKAGNHPQQRGLAAAGRPEQADERAVGHGEIDMIDRRDIAEAFGNALKDKAGHRASN